VSTPIELRVLQAVNPKREVAGLAVRVGLALARVPVIERWARSKKAVKRLNAVAADGRGTLERQRCGRAWPQVDCGDGWQCHLSQQAKPA